MENTIRNCSAVSSRGTICSTGPDAAAAACGWFSRTPGVMGQSFCLGAADEE